MATEYRGQMANAFAKGLQGGVQFVGQEFDRKQNREIKEQNRENAQIKAEQEATKRATQLEYTKKLASLDDPNSTAINAETQEQIAVQDTALKAETKNKTNAVLNSYRGASTQEESKDAIS